MKQLLTAKSAFEQTENILRLKSEGEIDLIANAIMETVNKGQYSVTITFKNGDDA